MEMLSFWQNNWKTAPPNFAISWLTKKEVAKIEHVDYRKEKQQKLEKEFKPDVLTHQIKFLNYILGDLDLIDQDLLTSLKGVGATGKHAAKVNPV